MTPKPEDSCRPCYVWHDILVQKTEVLEQQVHGRGHARHRPLGLSRRPDGGLVSGPASALVFPALIWVSGSRGTGKQQLYILTHTPKLLATSKVLNLENCKILISTKLRSMKKEALT